MTHNDLPDLTWIIAGELAAMGKPGTYTGLRREFDALRALGILRILSLTEIPLGVGLGRLPFSRVDHLPIDDFAAPTMAELEHAVALIDDARCAGEPLLVHCYMGLGRTGTVLAAYLVSLGMEPGAAVDRIRGLRPGSIENVRQLDAVYEYAAHLAVAREDDRD